jgi:hypothetical protein
MFAPSQEKTSYRPIPTHTTLFLPEGFIFTLQLVIANMDHPKFFIGAD